MSSEDAHAPPGIPRGLQAGMLASAARGYRFGEHLNAMPPRPSNETQNSSNALETYFDQHQEGPGLWKWRHYFDIYERHFSRFVGRDVVVLEIGVYCGGSLGMWQHYFGPRCTIYGIDVMENCRVFEGGQIKILIGDQSSPEFLKRLTEVAPVIDIIIDDGSHYPEHQIASFEGLFSHLSPGGVYLIEDVYNEFNAFHDYLHGLSHHMNRMGPPVPGGSGDIHDGLVTNSVQRDLQGMHRYPYVTVVEKRKQPIPVFSAPRQGSEWVNAQEWHDRAKRGAL